MNMPLRPAANQLEIVRVPMSRAIWKRLAAEAILLDMPPAELVREILVAAFASGDLSSLRSAEENADGIRFCISSVASNPEETLKQK